ncbi:MAG: hypothetical protein R2752_18970 [Vicinamibacterales bacterium]
MAAREIRAFDYVNQPYASVRDLLAKDAGSLFRSATKVAEARTGELVAALSVDIQGLEVSRDITIRIGDAREDTGPRHSHVTHIPIEWQAKDSPGLFPVMKADLAVYPLSSTETQVELTGRYEPPMGIIGKALDAAVGHRIAEASVHRFVTAVVEHIRQRMAHK